MGARKSLISWGGLLVVVALVACTKKETADPIVLPPGQLVDYSNGDFIPASQTYYSVELQKLDDGSKKFFTIQDLTPASNKDTEQSIRFIIPKTLNAPGVFILRVAMPRTGVNYSAFVIPEKSIRPSVVTTLVVELLKNYPGVDLNKIGVSDIVALEDEARQMVSRCEQELRVTSASMSTKQWLRFVENYAARDPGFLRAAANVGLSFSVDGNGQANSTPYPFTPVDVGIGNTAPVLDAGNSTPRTRNIAARETEDVRVRARMQDSESDFMIYQWLLDGVPHASDAEGFIWTPTFSESRAQPYVVTAKVSDGGIPIELTWNVDVADRNRAPEIVGTCDLKAKETEPWSCTIEAIDFDEDPISFTLTDKSAHALATIEGQTTDPVSRTKTITGKTKVKIDFTPDNYDARKHTAYLEVLVDDGKLGKTYVPLNLVVDDINDAPTIKVVNGSVIQPLIPGTTAHEFDSCTKTDPDTGGTQGFRFFIEVNDPDNQLAAGPRAALPDIVTLSGVAGSLSNDVVPFDETMGCPVSTPAQSFFCFEWQPKSTPHDGTLSFTVRDDHGGVTTIPNDQVPASIVLTSADRNMKPCWQGKGGGSAGARAMTDQNPKYDIAIAATDADNTFPLYEIYNADPAVVPVLYDPVVKEWLVFRKTRFNPSEFVSRLPKTTSPSVTVSMWETQPVSGYLTLTRASVHTADITIAKNTVFKTNTPTLKVQYLALQDVIFGKNDLSVTIPVISTNRDVPVGKLNRFISTIPVAGMTVTNSAILKFGASGTVTMTRPSSGTTLTVPHGAVIGTSEIADGSDTVQYETMDDVTFKTTDLSKTFRVRRLPLTCAVDTITNTTATWPGPAISITNSIPLPSGTTYSLIQEKSAAPIYCISARALDDTPLGDHTILSPPSALPNGVSFELLGTTEFEGWVTVKRTTTTSAQTVAAGQTIGLANHTDYVLVEDAIFSPGDASVVVPIRRTNAYGSVIAPGTDDRFCGNWVDTNYPPQFLGSTNVKVTEGTTLLDFPIEVTDNTVDPTSPKDPLDLHTFTASPLTAPAGSYAFCREPGTDPNDVNANCTSCATPMDTYWTSAICYLRFKPQLIDNGKTFSFNVEADDHGNPGGANKRQTMINVSVVELNDPPFFTDNSYVAATGFSKDHPINETAPWDYIEGLDPGYRLYMADADWGTDTRNIMTPTIVKTWQFVSPAGWTVVPNPRGLSMALTGPTTFLTPPPGSRSSAYIIWKPWDEDAKRLAGPNGFVAEVRACDQGNADSPAKCSDASGGPGNAFYKLSVKNQQNAPTISSATPISTITAQADKYFIKDFTLQDPDYAVDSTTATPVPATANFQSNVSLCSGGVYDCVADRTGWPAVLGTFDAPYANNKTDTNCQNSSGTMFYTVPEFRMPAFTATAANPCPVAGNCLAYTGVNGSIPATYTAPPVRSYTASFRWCPQRKHIGKHTITFNVRDNGDQDFRGPSSLIAPILSTFQVSLNVVAPVFFDSPKRDSTLSDGTASWWMKQAFTNFEYRYLLIPNNSKGNLLTVDFADIPAKVGTAMVGAVSLEVRSHANPGTVLRSSVAGPTNTMPKVTNVNTTTEQVHLVWKPYGATATTKYVSDPANQNTWPIFQVRVKDQTLTTEGETVKFRVQVKDYQSPVNDAPVISSQFPALTTVAISEQVPQVFSVSAADTNSDYLHYRWFLDGKLVNDAGPAYTYMPGMDEATTFAPGLAIGQHTLSVEVLDGVERTGAAKVYRAWNIVVRNTSPFPTQLTYWDSAKAAPGTTAWTLTNWAAPLGAITAANWGPTIGIGVKGTTANNYLMFTGQYVRAAKTQNYVGRLLFTNGNFTSVNAGTSSTVQLREGLPWAAGKQTEHVSYIMSASNISKLLLSSVANPEGTFSATTDALQLDPNLASYATPALNVSGSAACTGTCAQNFFTGFKAPPSSGTVNAGTVISSGTEATASYDASGTTYMFFSADNRTTLKFARFATGATTIATMTGADKIADVAVNQARGRLYVTYRDPATARNYLRTYAISDVLSGTITNYSDLKIDDGVSPDNRVLDLVVDDAKNRVYARLPGTGGVVYIDDPASTASPGNANFATDHPLHFVGVTEIAESPNDATGAGRKLVFNPVTQLLYGVVGKQVFVIDTAQDSFGVKIYTGTANFDEIVTFTTDGLTLAIDRTLGGVYIIK